ncbi:hypothetical protein [Lysinibacillus agricola]|uniref:hypothetical protein n=1 Tax=Lysinibacillus agricola TaxID=2590012 RepID=UPI003C1FE8A8
MVRRRGTYKIKIRNKQLICPACQNDKFKHREVYMEIEELSFNEKKEKLTLQSFNCTVCGETRMFQEKNRYDHANGVHISIIEYTEVREA